MVIIVPAPIVGELVEVMAVVGIIVTVLIHPNNCMCYYFIVGIPGLRVSELPGLLLMCLCFWVLGCTDQVLVHPVEEYSWHKHNHAGPRQLGEKKLVKSDLLLKRGRNPDAVSPHRILGMFVCS